MSNFMDRLRSQMGYEPNDTLEVATEPTLLQRMEESSTLTTQQRFIGMGVAVLMTCVCWTLGSFSLLAFRISSFIFMFTLGNISALAATCFLVGPKKQLENMSQGDRRASAIAFVLAMVGTLVASLMFNSYFSTLFIVLPCMLVQVAALIWYCLTYIPGGQNILMGLIGRTQAQAESIV